MFRCGYVFQFVCGCECLGVCVCVYFSFCLCVFRFVCGCECTVYVCVYVVCAYVCVCVSLGGRFRNTLYGCPWVQGILRSDCKGQKLNIMEWITKRVDFFSIVFIPLLSQAVEILCGALELASEPQKPAI